MTKIFNASQTQPIIPAMISIVEPLELPSEISSDVCGVSEDDAIFVGSGQIRAILGGGIPILWQEWSGCKERFPEQLRHSVLHWPEHVSQPGWQFTKVVNQQKGIVFVFTKKPPHICSCFLSMNRGNCIGYTRQWNRLCNSRGILRLYVRSNELVISQWVIIQYSISYPTLMVDTQYYNVIF